MSSGHPYKLTYQDYLDIQNEAPHVRAVAPVLQRQDIREVSEFGNTNGQVIGVPPHFNTIRYLPLAAGRWLNDADDTQKRFVCVIGDEMLKNLFPGWPNRGGQFDPAERHTFRGYRSGPTRRPRRRQFDQQSRLSALHHDAPVLPAEGRARRERGLVPELPATGTRGASDLAREEVRKIIARNHGFDWHNDDAFEDWDTVKNAETVGKIFDVMDMFLGGVGLVTLALGAIGIINIMLVAVSERTREIGLRKALGATNRSILLQFFLEGAFLTLMSGGIGMGGAALLMAALSGIQGEEDSILPTCRSCRPALPSERCRSPESSPGCIPRARRPCCNRWTP